MSAEVLQFPARGRGCGREKVPADPFEPVLVKRGTRAEEHRKAMLAKLHINLPVLYATLPHFNRSMYEGILAERYGVRSAASLNHEQLSDLLLHLQALGFECARGSARKKGGKADRKQIPVILGRPADPRYPWVKRIEALLAEKGRGDGSHVPWNYAHGILKRQTGGMVKHLDQATAAQIKKVMIALDMSGRRAWNKKSKQGGM